MDTDIDNYHPEAFHISKSLPAMSLLDDVGIADKYLSRQNIYQRSSLISPPMQHDLNFGGSNKMTIQTGSDKSQINPNEIDIVQEICDKYTKLAANRDYDRLSSINYTDDISKSTSSSESSFAEFPETFPSSFSLGKLHTYPPYRLDPDLNLTPDKRYTTFTTRLRSPSGDFFCKSTDPLRESRVRFDPDVAVHQLSPDNLSLAASSPNTSLLELSSHGHLHSSYDNNAQHDEDDLDSTLQDNNSIDWDRYLSSYNPSASSYSSSSDPLRDLLSGGMTSSDPDDQATDDEDPVSVIAADLRKHSILGSTNPSAATKKSGNKFMSNSAPPAVGQLGKSSAYLKGRRSWPEFGVKSRGYGQSGATEKLTKKQEFAPLKDFSAELEMCECLGKVDAELPEMEENVLARPGLNSTLRLSRNIEKVKKEEFNPTEVLKSKMDQKTKQKIEEKANSKLNISSPQFSNLISLDVNKDDLMRKVAAEKSLLVKKDANDKLRHEDLISRVPDQMEFFTDDLQRESVSHSLPGVSLITTSARTIEPVRAFDLYRHVRQWRQW